jgi:Holliday junction resolvasome RuvABC DNA-binding subunit
MMEKFHEQNRVLDAVFHAKMKTSQGVEALQGLGVEAEEARRVVMEAARRGNTRRAMDAYWEMKGE